VRQTNYQYRINGDAAYYIKLAKRIVLKTAYAGGWMSGQRLFQNEMYQLGGFRLLRGFDEGSLFVSHYHVATAEFRLILGRTSNIYLFSDNGWLQSRTNGVLSEGIYNGFGVGTSLDTKTGVFTIAYALGRSPLSPVQLRQSKIHIGYAAYF
jgi:hemolysin activation/secretion protein